MSCDINGTRIINREMNSNKVDMQYCNVADASNVSKKLLLVTSNAIGFDGGFGESFTTDILVAKTINNSTSFHHCNTSIEIYLKRTNLCCKNMKSLKQLKVVNNSRLCVDEYFLESKYEWLIEAEFYLGETKVIDLMNGSTSIRKVLSFANNGNLFAIDVTKRKEEESARLIDNHAYGVQTLIKLVDQTFQILESKERFNFQLQHISKDGKDLFSDYTDENYSYFII